MTQSITDVHGFLGCQSRQDDAKRAKKRRDFYVFRSICTHLCNLWMFFCEICVICGFSSPRLNSYDDKTARPLRAGGRASIIPPWRQPRRLRHLDSRGKGRIMKARRDGETPLPDQPIVGREWIRHRRIARKQCAPRAIWHPLSSPTLPCSHAFTPAPLWGSTASS